MPNSRCARFTTSTLCVETCRKSWRLHDASELTRQVLGVGRRQSRRPEQLSVNSVVEEVSRMLTNLLGEDVELQLSVQNGLGAVTADSGQLEQILLNLAVNARDAMPDGGKLVI